MLQPDQQFPTAIKELIHFKIVGKYEKVYDKKKIIILLMKLFLVPGRVDFIDLSDPHTPPSTTKWIRREDTQKMNY